MAGELDATQQQELNQIAEVQARCGWVETAVVRDRITRQQLSQLTRVGRDVHQTAPDQFIPYIRKRFVVALGCKNQRVRHAVQASSEIGPSNFDKRSRLGVVV